VPVVAESSVLESTIRRLAAVAGERAPVTTLYLDLEGRRHLRQPDVAREVEQLLRSTRPMRNGSGEHPSVRADLARIIDVVRGGFDRARTRGVVIVACSEDGIFEVVELPVAVHDRLVVNHVPAMGPLEQIVGDHEPVGVLLADRQRTRVLVSELGELLELGQAVDELTHGDPGHHDRGDLAHAVEAATHSHLRRAADAAWQQFQERPFDHLVVGAPDAVVGELVALLHPYLRQRFAGRIPVGPGSGAAEVRAAVAEVERRVERERQTAVVGRLRQEAHSGRRGVIGLAPTLDALNGRRVERLVVSAGYAEEGWRCPATGTLAAVGPRSPVDGRPMDRVADVVADAVHAAIGQGCRVDICTGNADLDVMGRIGALLRY
jgi:peptide chain release factor subunit 1